MNLFNQKAHELDLPFWINAHSDALCGPDDLTRLIELAESSGDHWHSIFTNHDVLCAIRTDSVRKLGGWDINFPNYFSDNDMNRRARLAGYQMIQLENHTVQHGIEGSGSQTINSDPALRRINQIMFPAWREIYRAKWGAPPEVDPIGNERFDKPWNV